ncbi:MAG: transporter substrate-binding domain-containing protein [Oscillospiraceae bacterium]|nr:transporter substrate-binding domain-containing protein [Oscillospiraceae bacterium]
MKKYRLAALIGAAALFLSALSGCGQPASGLPPESSPAQGDAPQVTDMGGDLLAKIRAKGEIVVALEGTWAPWGYHDESGALVGYDVEVAQAVAAKLGVEPSFVEGEWSALLAGLEAGRYDIMVNGVEIDDGRREKYDFSVPYAYNRTAVIVRADDDSIRSMEDLEGKNTANTLSSTYAILAESYGAAVTPVDDFIQTIELLTSGRIDATLNADVSYYDYLAQHPDAPIKIACFDPAATQVAIPMFKGEDSDALRSAINQALAELAQDGTLTELSMKYFGRDISKAQ